MVTMFYLPVQTDMPSCIRQLGEERRFADAMRSLNDTPWKAQHGVPLGLAGQIMGPGDLLVHVLWDFVS